MNITPQIVMRIEVRSISFTAAGFVGVTSGLSE
jgi:hypothetical protein